MMRLAPIILLLSLGSLRANEEALVSGGQSPNKLFRVVLAEPADEYAQPSAYFRYLPNGKIVGEHFVGGYVNYQGAKQPGSTEVAWSPDSRYAAIKSRGTKRSTEVTIYKVSRSAIREIKTSCEAEVSTLLGASAIIRHLFEKPLRWRSATEFLLDVTGDCFIGPREAGDFRSFHFRVCVQMPAGKTKFIEQLEFKADAD